MAEESVDNSQENKTFSVKQKEPTFKSIPTSNIPDIVSEEHLSNTNKRAEEFIQQLEANVVAKNLPDQEPQNYLQQDLQNLPKIEPASPERLFEIDNEINEALTTGKYKDYDVVGETMFGGQRALKVKLPEGEEITVRPGLENIVGQTLAPLPETLNATELQDYVEEVIQNYEKNWELLLEHPDLILSLANQIGSYPGRDASVVGPAGIDIKNGLVEKIERRLYLTLMNWEAIYGMADRFTASMGNFGRSGFEYFGFRLDQDPSVDKAGENLRVREVIHRLENSNEGEYYRLNTRAEQAEYKNNILFGVPVENPVPIAQLIVPGSITEQIMTATGLSKEEAIKKAKRSLDYADKLLVISGQATFYGGPTNPITRRLREAEIIDTMIAQGVPGFSANSVDMQSEEYWEEWEKVRRDEGIRVVPPAIPGANIANPASCWIDPDNGDIKEVGHSIQAIFQQAYFAPEVLELNKSGNASHLRFAAETRARSFAFFRHQRTFGQAIDDMNKYIGGDINNMAATEPGRWVGMIKGANSLYNMFFKEKPALLSVPFKSPDVAMDNPRKALESMTPFVEIAGAYDYLLGYAVAGRAADENFKARSNLLKNLLWYVSTDKVEVRQEIKEKFGWRKWNNNLISASTDDLNKVGVIRHHDYDKIMHDLKEDTFWAIIKGASQNGSREAGEGLGKFFVGLLKVIKFS